MKNNKKIKFIKLNDEAVYPTKSTKNSACLDLYTDKDCIINPGEKSCINTGIRIEMPFNVYASIKPRSGLSLKGLIVILGTIDNDYNGEIKIILHNTTNNQVLLEKKTRLAQISFEILNEFIFIDNNNNEIKFDSKIRTNGFGSTGYK